LKNIAYLWKENSEKLKKKGDITSRLWKGSNNSVDPIVAVSYYDSKIVHFLSNAFGVHPKRSRSDKKKNLQCPSVSSYYNWFMNGGLKNSYYIYLFFSYKWIYLIHTSIVTEIPINILNIQGFYLFFLLDYS
jgi:hypothetical protein